MRSDVSSVARSTPPSKYTLPPPLRIMRLVTSTPSLPVVPASLDAQADGAGLAAHTHFQRSAARRAAADVHRVIGSGVDGNYCSPSNLPARSRPQAAAGQ